MYGYKDGPMGTRMAYGDTYGYEDGPMGGMRMGLWGV